MNIQQYLTPRVGVGMQFEQQVKRDAARLLGLNETKTSTNKQGRISMTTTSNRITAALDERGNRVDALLQDRQKTHGSFQLNAFVSQTLKNQFRDHATWSAMSHVQREALDVIALKISRILSGQSFFTDHWDDIAGYAALASREIQEMSECSPTTQPSGSPSPQPRTLSRRKAKSGRSKTL